MMFLLLLLLPPPPFLIVSQFAGVHLFFFLSLLQSLSASLLVGFRFRRIRFPYLFFYSFHALCCCCYSFSIKSEKREIGPGVLLRLPLSSISISLCCRRNNIRSRRFVGVSIISPVGKECRPSFWYEFGFFWRFFLLWQLLGFDVELMPEQV
jgi:hypothetical protein